MRDMYPVRKEATDIFSKVHIVGPEESMRRYYEMRNLLGEDLDLAMRDVIKERYRLAFPHFYNPETRDESHVVALVNKSTAYAGSQFGEDDPYIKLLHKMFTDLYGGDVTWEERELETAVTLMMMMAQTVPDTTKRPSDDVETSVSNSQLIHLIWKSYNINKGSHEESVAELFPSVITGMGELGAGNVPLIRSINLLVRYTRYLLVKYQYTTRTKELVREVMYSYPQIVHMGTLGEETWKFLLDKLLEGESLGDENGPFETLIRETSRTYLQNTLLVTICRIQDEQDIKDIPESDYITEMTIASCHPLDVGNWGQGHVASCISAIRNEDKRTYGRELGRALEYPLEHTFDILNEMVYQGLIRFLGEVTSDWDQRRLAGKVFENSQKVADWGMEDYLKTLAYYYNAEGSWESLTREQITEQLMNILNSILGPDDLEETLAKTLVETAMEIYDRQLTGES